MSLNSIGRITSWLYNRITCPVLGVGLLVFACLFLFFCFLLVCKEVDASLVAELLPSGEATGGAAATGEASGLHW